MRPGQSSCRLLYCSPDLGKFSTQGLRVWVVLGIPVLIHWLATTVSSLLKALLFSFILCVWTCVRIHACSFMHTYVSKMWFLYCIISIVNNGERVSNCHMGYQKWVCRVQSSPGSLVKSHESQRHWLVAFKHVWKGIRVCLYIMKALTGGILIRLHGREKCNMLWISCMV